MNVKYWLFYIGRSTKFSTPTWCAVFAVRPLRKDTPKPGVWASCTSRGHAGHSDPADWCQVLWAPYANLPTTQGCHLKRQNQPNALHWLWPWFPILWFHKTPPALVTMSHWPRWPFQWTARSLTPNLHVSLPVTPSPASPATKAIFNLFFGVVEWDKRQHCHMFV